MSDEIPLHFQNCDAGFTPDIEPGRKIVVIPTSHEGKLQREKTVPRQQSATVMADLNIAEYTTYEEFARAWEGSDADIHMLWQLLGQLDSDELLIEIPDWLAEEKVGYTDGATPTAFVGRIERETEKAVLFSELADARPLMKLAHRMDQLERGSDDADRDDWLDNRLADHRRAFEAREDMVMMQDEWLSKPLLFLCVHHGE